MSYHAIHPEPVAPDCPMCGDPLTVPGDDDPAAARWGWLVVAVVLLAAIAAVAWRITR